MPEVTQDVVEIDGKSYELLSTSTDESGNRMLIVKDAAAKTAVLVLSANPARQWFLYRVSPFRSGNGWAEIPSASTKTQQHIVLE